MYSNAYRMAILIKSFIESINTPIPDKSDSSEMSFNECKSIGKTVISDFSNAYPTVIDVDSSTLNTNPKTCFLHHDLCCFQGRKSDYRCSVSGDVDRGSGEQI